jgi:hypothetical protein
VLAPPRIAARTKGSSGSATSAARPPGFWLLTPGSSTAYCLLLTAYCLLSLQRVIAGIFPHMQTADQTCAFT